MLNLPRPVFQPDPEKRPTFLEGCVLILERDYRGARHNYTTRFNVGELCQVVECGLSEYNKDSNRRYQKNPNGVEWCAVKVCGMGPEPDECCVKAADLRELTYYEISSNVRATISRQTGN